MQPIDWFVQAFIAFIGLVGFVANGSYISEQSSLFALIILFIPSYYFFRVCDFKNTVRGITISAYFSAVYLFLYYFIHLRGNESYSFYSMNFGYWAALPICVFCYLIVVKKRILNILFLGPLIVLEVLFGSRGSLILTLGFIALTFIVNCFRNKKPIFSLLRLSVVALIIVYFSSYFLSFLSSYASISRNISKLMVGDLFSSVGRDDLYLVCKRLVEINPSGYGPLGSRKLITGYPYPHSLIYELQIDFGRVIGAVFFALIMIACAYSIWKSRKYDISMVVGIIIVTGVGALFVSSSLYQEYYVPAILAISSKLMHDSSLLRKRTRFVLRRA